MKKATIIFLSLFIVLSLEARGVTENVANEGIKGVSTYLDSLEKIYGDESLSEDVRNTLSDEVYRGKRYSDAVNEYLEREESERLIEQAEKERLEREAENEPLRLEYEREKERKDEEERLRREEEERKKIALEEEISPSIPLYEGIFEYRGIISRVSVLQSSASFTIPDGMTDDDFALLLEYISSKYPSSAAVITFSVVGHEVMISYPQMESDVLLSIVERVRKEAEEYIDAVIANLLPQEEALAVEETASEEALVAPEAPLVSETLTYKGVTSTVVVDNTYASFTIPEGMTDEDIQTVLWYASYLFPRESSVITYSLDGGKISLTYPQQSDEFLIGALNLLREEAMAIIDKIQLQDEEQETAIAEAPLQEVVEEKAVYEDVLTYKNVTSRVSVYSTYATLTVPEGMTEAEVIAVVAMINSSYKNEAALVTYSLSGDVLTLRYPEQNESFLLSCVDALRAEAIAFIDSLEAQEEEKIVETAVATASQKEEQTGKEAVVNPESRTITATFSYRGIQADLTAGRDEAVIILPEGTTAEDVADLSASIIEAYPDETKQVSYILDGEMLSLYYPECDISYLEDVVKILFLHAYRYIDSLYEKSAEYEENSVVVERDSLDADDIEEVEVIVETMEPEEYETTQKDQSSPLSSAEDDVPLPKAVTPPSTQSVKKKADSLFNVDFSLGLKGKLRYYRGDDHLYPTFSVTMRLPFSSTFYVESGFDFFTYMYDEELFLVAGTNMNLGLNYAIGAFDIFSYAGFKFQLSAATSSFSSGMSFTFGTGIDWRITDKIIVGGGYEFSNSLHLFNAWVKFRL